MKFSVVTTPAGSAKGKYGELYTALRTAKKTGQAIRVEVADQAEANRITQSARSAFVREGGVRLSATRFSDGAVTMWLRDVTPNQTPTTAATYQKTRELVTQ